MKFPEFIIIGSMKCGTTPLWHNLNKHPGISMCKNWEDPKTASTEIRFWNNGTPYNTWVNKDVNWYRSLFNGDVCGEKSANYIESRIAMERIAKYIPDVKLVLCVRSPAARAYSEFNMQGGEDKFGKFSFELSRTRGYLYRSSYYLQIENNVLPFFPVDNLYIIVQEKMYNNTALELDKLYKFLGVSSYNIGTEFTTAKEATSRSLNLSIDSKIKKYKKWSSVYEDMDKDVKDKLIMYFNDHNEALYKFIGYKIEEW